MFRRFISIVCCFLAVITILSLGILFSPSLVFSQESIVDPVMTTLLTLEAEYSAHTAAYLESFPPTDREAILTYIKEQGIVTDRLEKIWTGRGVLRSITGWRMAIDPVLPRNHPATAENLALAFLDQYAELFGITDPFTELYVRKVKVDQGGNHHVWLQQIYEGIPVFHAKLIVHLDNVGRVTGVTGFFVPGITLNTVPLINEEEAKRIAALLWLSILMEIPLQQLIRPVLLSSVIYSTSSQRLLC